MSTFSPNFTSRSTEDIKADVLLVTATDIETDALLQVFKEQFGRDFKRYHIGNHTYLDLGLIGGARVFLVRSRMGSAGPGASLLTVRDAIEALEPSTVIMVGIAFGVDPEKQSIGDILISEQLRLYDLQRVGSGANSALDIRWRGDRVTASTKLLDRFRSALLDWKGPKVRFGLLLSGEKLVDHQDFRDQLLEKEPEAIGGEMEGAGVYVAAQTEKVDWLVVKAICDFADGNKGENKEKNQEDAAKNAARFVIHTLQKGGFTVTISVDAQGAVVVNLSPGQEENVPEGSKSRVQKTGVSQSQVSQGSTHSPQTEIYNSSLLIIGIFIVFAVVVIIVLFLFSRFTPNQSLSLPSPSPTFNASQSLDQPTRSPESSPVSNVSQCITRRLSGGKDFSMYPDYDPSGLMGDIGDITTVQKNTDGVRFRYETQGRGPHEFEWKYVDGQLNTKPAQFAGVMYLSPPNNFGNQPGFDLRATRRVIKWEARSISGPANVEFVIGGVTWRWDHQQKKIVGVDCPDSLERNPLDGIKTLNGEWQSFEVDLSNLPPEEFSNVIGGFGWVISWGANGVELDSSTGLPKAPKTFEIEIRNIRYER